MTLSTPHFSNQSPQNHHKITTKPLIFPTNHHKITLISFQYNKIKQHTQILRHNLNHTSPFTSPILHNSIPSPPPPLTTTTTHHNNPPTQYHQYPHHHSPPPLTTTHHHHSPPPQPTNSISPTHHHALITGNSQSFYPFFVVHPLKTITH